MCIRDRAYGGNFDGQGYAVSGLYCVDETMEAIGFIGKTDGYKITTVQNVGITNFYFKGNSEIAGLVGSNAPKTISNCFAEGTVDFFDPARTADGKGAGIAGTLTGGRSMISCYSRVKTNAEYGSFGNKYGGLVYKLWGDTTIKNS